MRYLLGLAAAAIAIFTGIGVLSCPSVSFSGAYRTVNVMCLPEGYGDVPGWLAGAGLIVGGLVVAVLCGYALWRAGQ